MLLLTCWNEVSLSLLPHFCSATIMVPGPMRAADKQAWHELIKVNVSPPRPVMSCGAKKNTVHFFSPPHATDARLHARLASPAHRERTIPPILSRPSSPVEGGRCLVLAEQVWGGGGEGEVLQFLTRAALLSDLNEDQASLWAIYQATSACSHRGRRRTLATHSSSCRPGLASL